jgi:hypothetical protein
MIRRPSQKKNVSRPSWLVRKSYLVPVVFIVAFASIGVRLLLGSNAQVPCTRKNISVGQRSVCVQYTARMLDATDSHWGGEYLSPSNNFTAATLTQVKKFQAATAGQANGMVGPGTWRELCYADNVWHGAEGPFNSAGCSVAFGVKWGDNYSTRQ